MDNDFHRLLYRNAELETEVRFLKEQLSQANNANTYLLTRISSEPAAHQIPRAFLHPHLGYAPTSIATEELDLLNLDDPYDSGYYETPSPLTSTPAAAALDASPAFSIKHVSKDQTVERKIKETLVQLDEERAEVLIDNDESEVSPADTVHEEATLRPVRSRRVKDSLSRGYANVYGSSPDVASPHGIPEPEPRPAIQKDTEIDQDGEILFEPTGPTTPAEKQEPEPATADIQPKEQQDPRDSIPQPPPQAPTEPANYSRPYRRDNYNRSPRNGIHASRFAPYPPFREPRGPQNVTELFAEPSDSEKRNSYRTVIVTGIPQTTEIAKILQHVGQGLEGISMIPMAGMRTIPPIETNAGMLTFQDSVYAAKFVDKCNRERPFEFEAEVYLARTGMGGQFGKEKAPPPPPRYQPRTPVRMQMEEQQGSGEDGEYTEELPCIHKELDEGVREDSEAKREDETMMREGEVEVQT